MISGSSTPGRGAIASLEQTSVSLDANAIGVVLTIAASVTSGTATGETTKPYVRRITGSIGTVAQWPRRRDGFAQGAWVVVHVDRDILTTFDAQLGQLTDEDFADFAGAAQEWDEFEEMMEQFEAFEHMSRSIIRVRLDDDAPKPRPHPPHKLTLIDAMDDPRLFGSFFKSDSWLGWRAFIKAAFGLGDMTPDELAIYRKCTGRQDEPSQQMRDLVLCCGRRSGKSKILALIAVWIGCFHDFKPYLSAGELGVVQLVASGSGSGSRTVALHQGLPQSAHVEAHDCSRDAIQGRIVELDIHRNYHGLVSISARSHGRLLFGGRSCVLVIG